MTGKNVKQKLDLSKAKKYAPPNATLFHDPRFHRIRGCYRIGGYRETHGCALSVGQDVACRVVLTWLWNHHVKLHPKEKVPFDFPFTLDESS